MSTFEAALEDLLRRVIREELQAHLSSRLPSPSEAPSGKLSYSILEAAEVLGVSRNSAYRLVGTGALRAVRVGRRYLVPADALRAYLQAASDS
ncbi:helix-turn-helix domain-containing protein [Deinococcus yavapaiensis]|uniref:Excisionase family DNA binding protein n=1 Tax=Deinococcus yavapaiensis KR-236 TaxID=694435 RepID=A0A318SF36_9DEIO|nr:helix-turn-helix domain-containing protein [Deinococcus yavapaiensis]PYE51989.1 excisionase family DNA binding protein [Deinococcus yavapaiensis KR-236]